MNARLMLVICGALLLAACTSRDAASVPEAEIEEPRTPVADADLSSLLYLTKVEGLHVTGTAVEVDVETFRLEILGAVAHPLELSVAEVRALPETRLQAELVCPGFFVDRGFWTGVPVRALLERAGVRDGAREVSFTSVDGTYTQQLPLDKAMDGQVLVAFEFDDRDFHVLHGYPLRLVAPGEPGSRWVKWLGRITVQ